MCCSASRSRGQVNRVAASATDEPFVPLVLVAEPNVGAFADECGEDNGHLHDTGLVQVERLAGDAVQPVDRKPGLLPDLANRGVLGPFSGFDASVHGLPRSWAPRA